MSQYEGALEPGTTSLLPASGAPARTDHWVPWIAVILIGEITAIALLRAFNKPLWLDEIMGLLIAKLPSAGNIWAICKAGVDNQPPLYHLAMRFSVQLFRNDALGMRVPSVLGYTVFCLCLYRFVSRRTAPLYGLLALLFPALTGCWYYATEGRPYALLLACAGLAAVCWQSIVFNERRALMLVGLGLSLTCALNLHYYAVLLFVPFWIAELVRTYERGKLERLVWVVLTAPPLLLLFYLPVVRAGKANAGIPNAFFARPSLLLSFWKFAKEFFEPTIVALLCAGALYFAVEFLRKRTTAVVGRLPKDAVDRSQAFLILGFTAIPVFAILLSKFGTHIFFPRYGIAGMFGFAALFGLCAARAFRYRRTPTLILVLVLLILVVRDQFVEVIQPVRAQSGAPARMTVPQRIPRLALNDDLPIVPTNLDDFMQFFYYGDSRLRSRLFYLSSENLANRYLGFTFHERMMLGSTHFFGTQVVDYSKFIKQHPAFYVFGDVNFSEWVVPKLMADGAELQLVQGGPVTTNGVFADVCLKANLRSKEPPRL